VNGNGTNTTSLKKHDDDGGVMAIEHNSLLVAAVQFHTESILTLAGNIGEKIIYNVVHNYVETK
jgi:anthranilate synthase